MTDVFSSIFGRKKSKGPAPTPPQPATDQQDDFVIVPTLANAPSNLYPNVNQSQSGGDYETLFSFLNVQQSESTSNGVSRPGRPAPPIPAPRAAGSPFSYGLTPSSNNDRSAAQSSSQSQASSGYYISEVPFQISKSFGGGISVHQLKSELENITQRIKSPNMSEYEYAFNLEEQIIKEANLNGIMQR